MAMPAQAACLTTNAQNNCATYNNTGSLPTTATLNFTDSFFASNNYWQINTSTTSAASLSNWRYSRNGTTFTAFSPSFTTAGAIQVGTVFTTSTTPSAPAGNPFFIRVDLSSTATVGSTFFFTLYSNNDGFTNLNGRLDDSGSNGLSSSSRSFARVADPAVPGPLPLLGAAAAFGYSRKIRKAIRANDQSRRNTNGL